MHLSNKNYDILKWVAQILLPALGTFYFALGSLWGLPFIEQTVGTITAIDVFLGVLLGISGKNYEANEKYDGDLVIAGDREDQPDLFSLELTKHPEDIAKKKDLVLRVKN